MLLLHDILKDKGRVHHGLVLSFALELANQGAHNLLFLLRDFAWDIVIKVWLNDLEQTVDNFGDATGVNMVKKILNDIARVWDDVWHNLLLFAVHKKLDNLAEVAGQDRVDKFDTITFNKFEKAVK